MQSLVFNFLDELLFIFSTEFFTCKQLTITELDRDNWKVRAEGYTPLLQQAHYTRMLASVALLAALSTASTSWGCLPKEYSSSNQDKVPACLASLQAKTPVVFCPGVGTFLTDERMRVEQKSRPSLTVLCK